MARTRRSSITDRPARRRKSREPDWQVDRVVSVPAGPHIRSASLDEVLAAMRSVPAPEDWASLAPMLVPIFQRMRPYDDAFPEPLRTIVPPGISVSFAIDIGPALLHVTADIASTWGVSIEELTARALSNTDARAAEVSPERVFRHRVGHVPVAALQSGVGGASTFVLRPGSLARLFGPEPRLYVAPMRDLLVGLPPDVGREFALWLYAEFADQDPNCLAPIGFAYADGAVRIEAIDEEFGSG